MSTQLSAPGRAKRYAMATALTVTAALTAGCAADELGGVFVDIEVCASVEGSACDSPLDLGAFRFGDTHEPALGIRNNGTGILRLKGVTIVSGTGIEITDYPETVPPYEIAPLTLALTPETGPGQFRLAIESTDDDSPTLEVEVVYEGVAPVLVVCPGEGVETTPTGCAAELTVPIGEVRPTQLRDVTIMVRNAGTTTLEIAGVDVINGTTIPEAREFSILTSTAAGFIEAGESSAMVIRYQPADAYADEFTVIIAPADETTDAAQVHLTATTPPNEPPVAEGFEVVSQDTTVVGETGLALWFDGRNSFDPEGDPLVFSWSIVAAPMGSTATPETPAAQVTRLIPDKLGAYTLQLQVTDALGLVGFVDINLSIEPRYFLTVVMNWGTDAGDVDLHLVPAGGPLFGATDCYFEQITVDWGTPGDASDDPALLADSEVGTGQEKTVIRRPSPGLYDVFANYFDSRGGRTAEVTVTVLRDDESAVSATVSQTLDEDCHTWKAGTIEWPGGGFTPAGEPLNLQCYAGP